MDEVEGWLDPRAAKITTFLLDYQHANTIIGDVLEIGVYAGKYFLVLMRGLSDLEKAVAIDIFESEEPAIPSVQGRRAEFEDNLKKYAPHNRAIVMERNSKEVSPAEIRGRMMTADHRPFRFISIDGGHDCETVVSDLVLAEQMLMPGGIIALDDWSPEGNPQWPEVGEAEIKFQVMQADRLLHIGSIPNKLLMTNDPFWRGEYQRVLRDYARSMQ